MSTALKNLVWYHSHAPRFLKYGVLGALALWANDDGTFPAPATVKRLMAHKYLTGTGLSDHTVRSQLQLGARLGMLELTAHKGGRGIELTVVRLLPDGIARVTQEAVAAAAMDRRVQRNLPTVGRFTEPESEAADQDFHRQNLPTNLPTEAEKPPNKPTNGPSPLVGTTYEGEIEPRRTAPTAPVENANATPTQLAFGPMDTAPPGPRATHWARFAEAVRSGLKKGRVA